MIFDVMKRSIASAQVLIPVEELLGDCRGGRMPEVQPALLTAGIVKRIVDACSTSALALDHAKGSTRLILNYGECVGCGRCIEASEGAVLAAARFVPCGVMKQRLIRQWDVESHKEIDSDEAALTETAKQIRAMVGRALNIRQVDGGSCNGCEAEIVALNNPYYDLERFGMHFVASPKHADMLLVTGPITRNMAEAVKNTYEATPRPKLVVAVGACGCNSGIFAGSHAVVGGVDSVIPVDGYIPGCPPTPAMLLTGILQMLRQRR
jgi:Ni,Fe-hydrogenase III small subunit/NAD-dependent dihydropyrimidine dehydrogenase PreA subunit